MTQIETIMGVKNGDSANTANAHLWLPKGISLIILEISCCRFERKLKTEDIGLEQELNRELGRLGIKTVFDKERLKVFQNINNKSHVICSDYGFKFSGSMYAIPTSELKHVMSELKKYQKEYLAEKEKLIKEYDKTLSDWAEHCNNVRSGWGDQVTKHAFSVRHVESNTNYEIRSFAEHASKAGDLLMDSVGKTASLYKYRILQNKRKKGRLCVNRSSIQPMKDMKRKLKGLIYLDQRAKVIIDKIDEYLKFVPETGKVGDDVARKLLTTLTFIAEPDLITIENDDDSVCIDVDDMNIDNNLESDLEKESESSESDEKMSVDQLLSGILY